MEACGAAHHWARELSALGHRVELLSPREVRKFVSGNKDDAADARGIWMAAQHTDVRRVALKTASQQAELSLHRVRSHRMQVRTATINSPRGLLETAQRNSEVARRLRRVPGIGLLGATALAATLGDASAWRSARGFACSMGLTPRHTGIGSKVRMGGISKRGDAYIRTLLMHGARNLVRCAEPSPWIAQMLQRRPFNVVATAVAHKLSRTAWAMVAQGTTWHADHKAPKAAVA